MNNEMQAIMIGRKFKANQVCQQPDWNGQDVWLLMFYLPGEEIPCTGYPQYIVFTGNSYHITDAEEAMEYLEYLRQNYGFDEDGDLIGYDQTEPIVIG